MSQRVVGYEGDGRSRRPVFADEGPASVAVDALSAIGTISASRIRETAGNIEGLTGGAGPVERRQITDAERSVRAEQRPISILRPAAAVATPAIHEDLAMTVTPPLDPTGPGAALSRLAKAAQDAAVALEAKTVADHAWSIASAVLADAWLEVNGPGEPPAPPVHRPTSDGGRSTADELQASRRRGQANMQAQRRAVELTSAAAALRSKSKGTTGQKRTPEQRQHMRDAMLASLERRKAAAGQATA